MSSEGMTCLAAITQPRAQSQAEPALQFRSLWFQCRILSQALGGGVGLESIIQAIELLREKNSSPRFKIVVQT